MAGHAQYGKGGWNCLDQPQMGNLGLTFLLRTCFGRRLLPMDCSDYRANYAKFAKLPLGREVWDTPEWTAWMDHFHHCTKCSDWHLAQRVSERGHDPNSFPCVHIAEQLTHTCSKHPDLRECPDVLILYEPRFDEYSIPIRDGGLSGRCIRFCPWCGVRLPDSKRDRWFQELESLGYDDPFAQDIPEEYDSGKWHNLLGGR